MDESEKKGIGKPDLVSHYTGTYGKGEEAKRNFAFRLVPAFFYTLVAVVVSLVVTGLVLEVDLFPVIAVIGPIFSAPISFMLGHVYGKRSDD